MKGKTVGTILLVLIIVITASYAVVRVWEAKQSPATVHTNAIQYSCEDGKSFAAVFGEEKVELTLSDGRVLLLPQAVSGSGIRYEANGISFIGKGADGFVEENGAQTYVNCVVNAGAASSTQSNGVSSGTKQFNDVGTTFSFFYPAQFTVSGNGIGYSTDWMAQATTSGVVLAKLSVPRTFQPNTNFSEATFTVGTSADDTAVATCLTYNPSGGPATDGLTVLINGTSYTMLQSSDAGAGNLYETMSYRTVRNNQCYAIEYTVHSTNIGNYAPDQGVSAYDKAAVNAIFDGIIQSFTFK